MSGEILGMVSAKRGSETQGFDRGEAVDPGWIREFAQAHEDAGFDRVLIGYSATSPDGFAIATAVLNQTKHLKVLIAHRPGFVAPTVEARKLATLDQLTGGGRVAIHHISGGSDADQRRDGDHISKDERYARTGEFIEVLRRTLDSQTPFDFEGDFYRVVDAYSSVRPVNPNGVPIFFGGQSDAAVTIGAQHADTFMLFGEPLAATAERIQIIQSEARKHGRSVDFSISTRPIVADTEEAAWAKAHEIEEQIAEQRSREGAFAARDARRKDDAAVSNLRLQLHARDERVHDERLWFGATRAAGLGGNSTGHVGTPEQVADALIEYWDLGVRKFLIRGFDQLGDVTTWGEGLVPELRKRIDERESARAAA